MNEVVGAFTTGGHKPVLIEDWLPIRELGIESVRESAPIPGQFPKLKTLHVWWARVPLAAANGVILTSLLPVWDDTLLDRVDGLRNALDRVRSSRSDLRAQADTMTDADWYRVWVLWMCGVRGNAVEAKARSERARKDGAPLKENPFTWKQAFKNKHAIADLNVLHRLLIDRWGRLPRVLDPTAGGGSIPYTALRYGLPTWANDLNPVAVGMLDAALRASTQYGRDLLPDIEKWGKILVARCVVKLGPFFPSGDDGQVTNYVFANTVKCPRTGGPVPLSPNWWLDTSSKKVAVRVEPVWAADGAPAHLDFRLEVGPDFKSDPYQGTVAQGDAVSPWDGRVVDGDHIKDEAGAGRMWPTLYAVVCSKPRASGRGEHQYFRPPTQTDLDALDAAQAELDRLLPIWEADNVLPTEEFPPPIPKHDIRPYGFVTWRDFFTPRQLLVHGTFVEQWRELLPEVFEALGEDRGGEVMTLLALMQGKAVNWNSRLSSWDVSRQKMRSVFDRHDFAFKWTFAEFEGAHELFPWCREQLSDAYEQVAALLQPEAPDGLLDQSSLQYPVPGTVTLSAGSAASLPLLEDASIECVNIDPPYYDNVMYAELADYFYVWEKRILRALHPNRFDYELTNKDDEAIANIARFREAGSRRQELATFDYRKKMQAIFTECHRVLSDDGVMVVWFTHKRAEAWDTLGMAMMEAGFTIEASWPVATQSVVSLHHAKVNSAKSTVMLVCRKRRGNSDGVFFDDIEAEVRRAAVEAVEKFEDEVGVGGVDLLLSTYGPTLSVISRQWPVLSSEAGEDGRARRVKPEEALAVAREEVNRLVKTRLVGHAAQFDPATDFWVLCWATFQAREFPYDEARKLGMSAGFGVDDALAAGILRKKSGNVELARPRTRGQSLRRKLDENGRAPTLVDALHHLINSHRDDGLAAARTWLADSGYGDERAFQDVVQAAVNAVPRVHTKTGLSLDEARELEDLVVALFGGEVTLPAETDEQPMAEQLVLEV